MKALHPKSTRIILSVAGLSLFVLALIWISYLRQTAYDRKEAIRQGIEKNSNLAVALEQYAISTLRHADAILQLVRLEYGREGSRLDLSKILSAAHLNSDIVADVSLLDRKGQLVSASIPYPSGASTDFSDRSYFQFHLQHQQDSLFISKPLVSRFIGKTVLSISRRLNDKQGKFDGVVALQIEPSAFTSFYAEARLSPFDLISLIAPDGITYARRTGTKESSGEDIHKSPLFIHVAQHADSFYFAPDAIHNIPTWFSYRRLKEYPIIATVGSAESELLLAHFSRQSRMITPRIIISLLVVLFSVLISFILLYRLRASIRRREEQEQYKRLLTEQIIAAQEREREWIGREMHDNVSQVLTTVKLYLEMASTSDCSPLIPKSMQLVNQSITEIRSLSHQLTSPTLGTGSLTDSITALIETVRQSSSITIRFNVEGGEPQLPMDRKLGLYRILQELFNNIVKHSNATKVVVTLAQQEHQVLLSVKDNGKGFDSKRQSRGIGLNNIYSRANVLGGRIVLDTKPGRGCQFELTIPNLPASQLVVINPKTVSSNPSY